jgi:septum formation protein
MSLILASSSPRRQELIAKLGYTPQKICSPDVDETPHKGENPRQYVTRIACSKVNAVNEDGFILAADTTVETGRQLLGKAFNTEDARKNLERLSGRRHRVYTGICLKAPDGKVIHQVVVTRLTFKKLTDQEIENYLASGEWKGAAGSYTIQGYAEAFVKQINGSFSNVVGLPLYETKSLLEGAGCYV